MPIQFCGGISFPIACSQYSVGQSREIADQIRSQTVRYNPIFVSGPGHEDLIIKLRDHPLLFSFNHVWVMPIEYASMISLRLDNNIIFYEHTTGDGGAFNIYDSYAIKGQSSITTKLFQWPREKASLNIQMRALEGRTNLTGTILKYIHGRQWDVGLALQQKLNFIPQKIKSKEKRPKHGSKHKNGTWSGLIGLLLENETDFAVALMADMERREVLDFCWPTKEMKITLMGPKKGLRRINVWAYVVFPINAWIVGLVTFIVVALCFSLLNHESLMQGFTLVMRLFLQIGYELSVKGAASRVLLMTAALCLNIVYIYYASDLTATMTAEPQELGIRSFEDVERLGYEVAIVSNAQMPYTMLKSAPNGSAMQRIYKNKKFIIRGNGEELRELIESDPKTLAFFYSGKLGKEVIDIDIIEAATFRRSLSFKKGSEFSALFSHHLFKMQEMGIIERIKKKDTTADRNKEYGMAEPIVLGYHNLFFPFGWLALGIVVTVPTLVVEVLAWRINTIKHRMT